MANIVIPCRPIQPRKYLTSGMNAAIISAYIGRRALQLINGATKIVTIRSRRFPITRVAIMPGTAQAKEDNSGMKDLPLKPIRDIG